MRSLPPLSQSCLAVRFTDSQIAEVRNIKGSEGCLPPLHSPLLTSPCQLPDTIRALKSDLPFLLDPPPTPFVQIVFFFFNFQFGLSSNTNDFEHAVDKKLRIKMDEWGKVDKERDTGQQSWQFDEWGAKSRGNQPVRANSSSYRAEKQCEMVSDLFLGLP